MNLNCFPAEVLCRIFDYLPWKDRQRVVTLVCCRWNDIINSNHYLRRQKLVLYNNSKAKFFSGVGVELLNRQKHIELNSNAMLDTEELLQTIGKSFGSGAAMVTSLSLLLRSGHKLAFDLVMANLPRLVHLKELHISSATSPLSNGVRIDSASLEMINISFYQSTLCILNTPKLHTLHLTVRDHSEMDLLSSISAQLVEVQVSFISKEHVAKLFNCDFSSLKRLSISLKTDKYKSHSMLPVYFSPLSKDSVFAKTIAGLESLEVVDVCHIFELHFLRMFVYAKSIKALLINYMKLTVEVNEILNGLQSLKYLNLEDCQKCDEPKTLHLPALETLVMSYTHLPIFRRNHNTVTTLHFNNSYKNQTQLIAQIAKTFSNLHFLCLQNFDNELDSKALINLNLLTHLRILVIKNMSVSNEIFSNCPMVPQLKRLVMDTVVTEVSMLDVIPARFPALQRCIIDNCFLYLMHTRGTSIHYTTFDVLRQQMPYCCVSTKDSTIFTATAPRPMEQDYLGLNDPTGVFYMFEGRLG